MKRSVVLSIVLMLAVLAACGTPVEHQPELVSTREPVTVQVEAAAMTERQESVRVLGTVRARQTVVVSSRLMASILAVYARIGDRVSKGQILIELDDRELSSAVTASEAARAEADSAIAGAEQAIAAARAQLELANVTHKRFDDLLKKESLSQQEYDESTARVRLAKSGLYAATSQREQAQRKREQAEATIAMARTRLSYASIASPVSGIVVERLADPGSLANPGAPLLKIEPAGGYRLEVSVPETHLGTVKPGQTLSVRLDALGEEGRLEARVAEIVPVIDAASRTFTVKLSLPPRAAVKSGLYGSAILAGEARQALTIPFHAVIEDGQLKSVFVVENDIAKRRLITLGEAFGDRVEILSGLAVGDTVVLNPSSITDGAPVRVSGGPQR